MIYVFELAGTGALLDIGGNAVVGNTAGAIGNPWFGANLDPTKFTYKNVRYPAAAFPMDDSVADGVARLSAEINALPPGTGFVLIGTSQGAMVCSEVYNQLRSGSLVSRNADFLAGCMFGNPRRQAGHYTATTDPGGSGIQFYSNLTGCESRWYEFANPGDIACTNDHSTDAGQLATALFSLANSGWDGAQDTLWDLFTNPIWTVINLFTTINELFFDVTSGPHVQYGTTTPYTGDTRPCMTVARDIIAALAP